MTSVTVLSSSATSAWGHVRKFITHHAQGMEEGRVWVAEAWIRNYYNGKDHMQAAE